MNTEYQNKNRLTVRQGTFEKVFYLDQDEILVGRGPEVHVPLVGLVVSDRHLLIRISGDVVQIQDLGSEHGTFLEGRRLATDEVVTLRGSDQEVYLGNLVSITVTPKILVQAQAQWSHVAKVSNGPDWTAPMPGNFEKTGAEPTPDSRVVPLREVVASGNPGLTRFSEVLREEARRSAKSIIEKAEDRKKEIEDHKLKVENAINGLRAQMDALGREKFNIERQILETDLKFQALGESYLELEGKKNECQREIVHSKSKRDEIEREVNHLKVQLAGLKEEIESKREVIREHLAEVGRLQGVLNELRENISYLQKNAKRERELLEFEVRNHRIQNESIQAEFLAQQLSHEEAIARLESTRNSIENEIREAVERRAESLKEIEAIQKEVGVQREQAHGRMQIHEEEILRLSERIEGQRKTSERLHIEIASQHQEIRSCTAERERFIGEAAAARESLEQSLSTVSEFKKRAEFELASLRSEIEHLTGHRVEVQRERDRIAEETSRKKEIILADLARLEAEQSEWVKSAGAARAEMEAAQHELAELNQNSQAVEEQRKRAVEETEQNRAYTLKLEQELSDARRKLEQETSELTAKRDLLDLQIEQQRRQLQSELEREKSLSVRQLEEDAKAKRSSFDREMLELKAALNNELVDARKLEMDKISLLRKEAESVDKSRRNFVIEEIINCALEISSETPLDQKVEEFRGSILAVLEGKTAGTLSAKAAERSRDFWKKASVWSVPAMALILVAVKFPVIQAYLQVKLDRNVAAEKKESGGVFMEEIRQRGSIFQPDKQDRNYRDSYADNIIYLEGYVDMKLDLEKQKEWTLLLNDFIVGRLGLSDRVIPDFVASETVMVKELLELRKNIVMQFKEQGLQRLADTEKKDLEKLTTLLQSEENYKKFRSFERSFYMEYLTKKGPSKP